MFFTKKSGFKEKLRCDTLDIQIQNLVYNQDLCTTQKRNKKTPYIDSKKTHLWDITYGT
jgi:hypothetical protein